MYCGICYKQAAEAGQRLREDAAASLDALGGEGRPEAREANQDNDDNEEANKDNDNNASVPLGSDANWDDLGKTVFDKLTDPVYEAETAPCMAEVLGIMGRTPLGYN